MRPGFRLALSVTAGAVAILLMAAYAATLSARSEQERDKALREYGGPLTRVLVATSDIKAGSRITPSVYLRRSWVSELLPAGAVRDAGQLRGAKASAVIYAGEPILESRLETGSAGSVEVPAGLVAVSVPVQAELALGGDIHGGDRVSVVVSDGPQGAKRLADDVLVLATNIDSDDGERGGIFSSDSAPSGLTWATLAVAPQMEIPLVNVSESGRIHLTIHGDNVSAVDSSTTGR